MTTKTKPARLTLARGPYRITWHGGEYAEVSTADLGVIEVVNMTERDGSLPPMSREVLRAAIDKETVASWGETVRELRRFPVGGAR